MGDVVVIENEMGTVVIGAGARPAPTPAPRPARVDVDLLALPVDGENLPAGAGARPSPTLRGRELVAAHAATIEEMLERFRAWMRLDVADGKASPETLRAYFADTRDHLKWLLEEGLTPAQAGEDDLKAYRAYLTEHYATSTAGRKFTSVRRFYAMAYARHEVYADPAAGIKSPSDNTEEYERIKFLSIEQLRMLLERSNPETAQNTRARVKRLRDRAMLLLMMRHGLRVIELLRLDLESLDLGNAESPTVRVFGKRSKWRTIHLVDQTRLALEEWLAARGMMQTDSPAVFVSLHWADGRRGNNGLGESFDFAQDKFTDRTGAGQQMSTRGIRSMVDEYLEAIGAKKDGISCHSLRHSFGTWSVYFGADLRSVSREMGHSSIETTMVYSKVVDAIKSNPAKYMTFLE